jgi:hypothetical protein
MHMHPISGFQQILILFPPDDLPTANPMRSRASLLNLPICWWSDLAAEEHG